MMRRCGVLGGMGPEATLAFLERFYRLSRGRVEQERPPLLVDIDPAVPDRNRAWRAHDDSPADAIARMGRRLRQAGADFCVMPCVTAHGFADAFERDAGLPLLRLPAVAAEALAGSADAAPIGLLATTTTLDMGLFQRAFAAARLEILVPPASGRRTLMRAIYAAKDGNYAEAGRGLSAAASALADGGAKTLLLGCTDLSILEPPRVPGCTIADALDLLALRTFSELSLAAT